LTDGANNNDHNIHCAQAIISLSWNHVGSEGPSLKHAQPSVQHVVSLLFASICYCIITGLCFFNIHRMFVFLYFMFGLFSVLCLLCFGTVLRIFRFVYSCLYTAFVQVCRPLSTGGNPIAVNKCHIIRYC